MATAAVIDRQPELEASLDALGPVLVSMDSLHASLTWQCHRYVPGGFYTVTWADERGFFAGAGDTPSEAYQTAIAEGPSKARGRG